MRHVTCWEKFPDESLLERSGSQVPQRDAPNRVPCHRQELLVFLFASLMYGTALLSEIARRQDQLLTLDGLRSKQTRHSLTSRVHVRDFAGRVFCCSTQTGFGTSSIDNVKSRRNAGFANNLSDFSAGSRIFRHADKVIHEIMDRHTHTHTWTR